MSQVLPRDFGQPQPKPKKQVKEIKPYKWRQAKPIKQVGKVGKQWKNFREEYLTRYPGNWLGLHQCAHCSQWFRKAEITLDHVIKRSIRPDLRFVDSNIQKLCLPCHQKKDSGIA
jgi:5-methylcytosine-specific restriction endonuclease McrA